jgi:hypothetical protein
MKDFGNYLLFGIAGIGYILVIAFMVVFIGCWVLAIAGM